MEEFHRVNGEIYNMGPMIARSVKVICAYYDSEGELLAISDDIANPVSIIPGGGSRFDISSYPFRIEAEKYDLFVSVRRFERVFSANWILFSILVLLINDFYSLYEKKVVAEAMKFYLMENSKMSSLS